MSDLNVSVVCALIESIMTIVRDHFREGPPSRSKCYEILNALAVNSATVIAGTEQAQRGASDECRRFFMKAFDAQLADLGASIASRDTLQ